MADKSELRKNTLKRWEALKSERSSWLAHWREISQYTMPRSGRFLEMESEASRGGKKHNSIIDNTPIRAARTLGAGMMAGATSPARPWFRLTTSDPKLDEASGVKVWLADVTEVMNMIFRRSNTYRVLHSSYDELGLFGVAAPLIEDDFHNVINLRGLTAGEFCLAADHTGRPNTLYRFLRPTVAQMASDFGLERCSESVQNMHRERNFDQRVDVIHAIEPRAAGEKGGKPWRSVYLELSAREDQVLREGGFRDFPALAGRWMVYSGDVYGASPGMDALGDAKQLQHQQRRKGQAIDYKVNPPLQAPSSAKAQVDRAPGGISFVDQVGPQNAIRSLFDVNLDLSHLREDIEDVRQRINSAFYADLFLMLYNRQDDPRMTATEVAERHEEKLLMIGPVLERLHDEMLGPLVETTFARAAEAGILPPPPQELQGRELQVEFVSVLAQAQRAVATNGIDRFVMSLGQVATIKPEVVDKLDADVWADKYADMLGVDPNLIVAGDKVALIRQQRAQQQQAAMQAQQAEQAAGAAAKLGSIKTGEQNGLTDALSAFSGYT